MKKTIYIIGLAIFCLSCQSNIENQSISGDKVIDSLMDESESIMDDPEMVTGELEFPSPVILETPNFDGNTLPSASNNILTLKLESKKKNQITDDYEWFSNNHLSLPTYADANGFRNFEGNLPANVPEQYKDNMLTYGFKYNNLNIFFYGTSYADIEFLIITNNKNTKIEHFLDFKNFMYTPQSKEDESGSIFRPSQWSIKWPIIEGNILYISYGYLTSAKDVFGKNAYISAIDLVSYKIIWTTQSLTCNSTFTLVDNSIVCGYGTTGEPDFLYVLDKQTGERKQTIKLDKGPSYVIQKDNRIFVRTYDIDYVFNIQ